MDEPEVVSKLRDILGLDPKLHLFCEDEQRRKHAIDCLQILGFDGPDALPWHGQLEQRYNAQLASCDRCVVEYYKAKRKFVEDLRNDYDEEEVEDFVKLLDGRDIERIGRGLDNIATTLSSLPEEKRRQNAVSPSDLYAMFEALTCQSFLAQEQLLTAHFDEPFALLQTNKILRVLHWVPALSLFLFDEEKERSRWARENWSKITKAITREDFEFAIRRPVADQLNAALMGLATSESVSRLWAGLQIVVSKLDGDLITHSLRAMEQDIYRLALDHLQIDGPGFGPLLRTIQELLSRGPKDFWDAMGAIAPTTIIEQIFSSPQFNQRLSRAHNSESKDVTANLLCWIEPFVSSLQTSHKPQACRSLTDLLMSRLQAATAFPAFARAECYRIGLDVISKTLADCCESGFHFDGVGRAVALDTLKVTFEHIGEIVSVLKSTKVEGDQDDLLSGCFKTIKYALKLECNLIRTDRVKIHRDETLVPGFEPFRSKVWPAIEKEFVTGNLTLARICIEEISELTGLEGLESKMESKLPHEKERKQFNTAFKDLSTTMSKILEKVDDFNSKDLSLFAEEEATLSNLLKVLFSAQQEVSDAALDVIKTITGTSFRKEALSHLMQLFLNLTLDTVDFATSRIARARTFAACQQMLKLNTDILEILCDSQEGFLRLNTLVPSSLRAVKDFWKALWQTLRTVYESTQQWSFHIKTAIMTDFCRDVMQFSEYLFAQFAVFYGALRPLQDGNEGKETRMLILSQQLGPGGLLVAPSNTLEAIVGFLKLRDEWLLAQCVNLTQKVLVELTNKNMNLSDSLTRKLESMVAPFSKVLTNLTGQQKAEIRKALENNIGRTIADGSEERSGTSTPDVESQRAPALRSIPKQGIIDLESWSSKAPTKEENKHGRKDISGNAGHSSTQQIAKAQPAAYKTTPKVVLPVAMTKSSVKPRESSKAAQQAQLAKSDGFLKDRKQEQLEKKRRDAEAAAKAKKHLLPNSIAGITAGEGSALGNIGNMGKEHMKKNSEIMVSSSSESESEDEQTRVVFGPLSKSKPSAAVAEYNANRRHQLKTQMPVKKVKQIRTQKDLRARVAPPLEGVHKSILSWDFFHDNDFPPAKSRNDYSAVSPTFRTAEEYKATFEPLLLLEAWSAFRQAQEEASGKSFPIKIVSRMYHDSLVEMSGVLDYTKLPEKNLFEGDVLLLSKSLTPSQSPEQANCLARVFKITRKQSTMEVTFKVAQVNSLLDSLVPKAELRGEKITSLIPLEREYGALVGLPHYDLCDEIIKAYPSPLLAYNDGKLGKLVQCYELNRAQAKAVQSAIDNDAFTLIQGPPGSGKTKTIVAIVGALLSTAFEASNAVPIAIPQQASSMSSRQDVTVLKKLLVCAPSNAAVDELVMRLMKGVKTTKGQFQKPSVVRLGKSDSINAKVMEVTLDVLVEKKMNAVVPAEKPKDADEMQKAMSDHKSTCNQLDELKTLLDQKKATHEQYHQLEVLKRRKNQLSTRIDQLKDSGNTFARNMEIRRNHVRQAVIDGAHVLCATLSGSGHDMLRNLQLDFETVIVDEAAQAVELSCFIPLKYGCSKCIMVGDPKQLPPTVLSRDAARFQYEQSLFVRMQANSPDNVHLLDTQYRMHPDISAFPSRAFYDGRLLDGPGMAGLRQKPWHVDPLLSSYRFFDVQGMSQSAPKGHSLVNLAEIDIALKLFQRLTSCAKGYSFQRKIGIITPYKSQLGMLRDRFKAKYGEGIIDTIEFNTTDAFQGRESEVIIFSCVRASNTGIGFLSDIRRMNVGITRAKSSLWVLGNASSLMQGEYWGRLIEDSRERGRFTGDVLRALTSAPTTVKIAPDMERKDDMSGSGDLQDVEMPDAPGATQVKFAPKVGTRELVENRKRSPPSPVEHSHSTKVQRRQSLDDDDDDDDGDDDDHLNGLRQISPPSRESPVTPGEYSLDGVSKDSKGQPAKMRPAGGSGTAIVRPPGGGASKSTVNKGVRPPVAPKKKGDESAFILPKRRPR